MPFPASPDDRPDPLENMPAMRARIPEHVARGEVSTGVIVVTGGTEYVLDFVRNLPRPNMIVARVVLPHMVMPQFIDALAANVELFRQRYGDLPGMPQPTVVSQPIQSGPGIVVAGPSNPPLGLQPTAPDANSVDVWPGSTPNPGQSTNPGQSDLPRLADRIRIPARWVIRPVAKHQLHRIKTIIFGGRIRRKCTMTSNCETRFCLEPMPTR